MWLIRVDGWDLGLHREAGADGRGLGLEVRWYWTISVSFF